jgi:hypothetical protein
MTKGENDLCLRMTGNVKYSDRCSPIDETTI